MQCSRLFNLSPIIGGAPVTNDPKQPGGLSRQWAQGITAALTLALVVLLSSFLYQYDNQYTAACRQPSNGVLDLRQEYLDDQSAPYHLQNDWEFYPGVLLTPEDDFSHYPHTLHSLYKDTKKPQELQGTYRLKILLPDTPLSYVLKLPATFSAYRLYLNQDLILTMGELNTVDDAPPELFKDHLLTFWASGEVQLLIHYSDEGGIYNGLSGLSAPPILGRPLYIYTIAEYHQFFLATSVVLILLTLLLSVSLFLRSHQGSNFAMILLCLCAAAYLTYPLLSSEMLVPIYPWYQAAMLFYFGCHAATHWVYSLHFGWQDPLARFINWYSTAAVGLCAITLLITFYLPNGESSQLFYLGTRLLQWGAILCGIALTVRMVICGAPNKLMGASSVTLWSFMLIDLIAPEYSPVIFARFTEMGIICFMAISILVEYLDMASAHHFRILYAQKITYAEHLLKLEEQHYTQLSSQVEDARRIRHDLRQHLRVIRSLLDRGDSDAITAYLEQYMKTVQPLLEKPITFFQAPIVDALIAHYWSAAQKRGAEFLVKGQLQELPQSVYVDFCSIMGNLLENALDALDRQTPGQPKWIRVRCEILQKKLMLEVVNSNSVPIRQTENRFYSAKRDDLGTGTLSVSIIARQYGGLASFSQEDDHFTAQVLLPLSGICSSDNSEDTRPVSE